MKCPKCEGNMTRRGLWRRAYWMCESCGFKLPPNVPWIITVSVDDINYKTTLPRLTDEELEICFKMETRITSLQRLEGEKRRRERAKKKKGAA